MLETLFTWAVILAAVGVSGDFLMHLSHDNSVHGIAWYLPAGFVFVTVYAQLFSLFHRVGSLAMLLLFVLCLCMLISLHRRGLLPHLKGYSLNAAFARRLAFLIVLAVGLAFVTAQEPIAYDTSLYHAQAIRWVEEYGVVPGLGNLHYRLAYNSSFICLQALFSFRWLLGRSLHSVNGLICFLGISYAVLTQSGLTDRGNRKPRLSDFMKLVILFYDFEQRDQISSPSTDLFALTMCWFIFTRWTELEEQKTSSSAPYCVLTILSVYAMTLKLSCAMLVLLVMLPLVMLIRQKQFKRLWKSLLAGIVTVAPWMARSVIISGYLIYPVASIDLFDVDWKMNASILTYDSEEICVWSRTTKDVATYHDSLTTWVPVWFHAQTLVHRCILILGLAGILCMLVWLCVHLRRHTLSAVSFVGVITLIACTLTWFFAAPDLRYGILYPLLWTSFLLWLLLVWIGQTLILVLIIPLVSVFLTTAVIHDDGLLLQERDYPQWALTRVSWEGQTVILPEDGDQVGYADLPSTPYPGMLEKIELCGDSLKDGFRIRSEYRDEQLNGYGNLW